MLAGALFLSRLRLPSGGRSRGRYRPGGNQGGLCAVALRGVWQSPDSSSYSLQTHSGGASTSQINNNYKRITAIRLADTRRAVGQFPVCASIRRWATSFALVKFISAGLRH